MSLTKNLNLRLPINNLKWDIIFCDADDKRLDDALGITYRSDTVIYLDQGLSKQMLRRTIQHELVHAYIFSYGLDPTANCKAWNEEEIAQFFESHGPSIIEDCEEILKKVYK